MVLTLKQFFVIMMTMMSGVVDALKEHAICPVRISLSCDMSGRGYRICS